MLRLGIVGPGLIWQKRHRPALEKLKGDFEITAFCAATERHKAEVLKEFPKASFTTDSHAFMQGSEIDGVVVLTPIHLNAPLALEALKAGKDVFLEKPMAHSLEAGRELVHTARQNGRRLWILEQEVYHPRWRQLMELFAGGEIGDLVYYDYVVHVPLDSQEWNRGGYGQTTWRITPSYPLGPILDGGHHQVALLTKLFGVPEWLFASAVKLRKEFGDYDHIVTLLGNTAPLRGVFSHSAFLGEDQNSFTVWGTQGSMVIGDDRLTVTSTTGKRKHIQVEGCSIHEVMWQEMAQCIREGREPQYPATSALDDLTVLFAIEKSIKTQKKVFIKDM